jgi:hypothetical protein
MLDDDSTVTGQQFTVYSNNEDIGLVSREVNLVDGQADLLANQAGNGKCIRIFVVLVWEEEGFSTYCFQFIGQGASFCMTKNCATAHHHVSKKEVVPGALYVAKSVTMAFVTPLITSSVIDSDVLTEWRTLSLSLHKWNEKLFITTNASDDAPASSEAMEPRP